MMTVDQHYASLLSDLLDSGERISTRNSSVRRLVARQATFRDTPLVSLRRTAWRSCLREWEWFMSGSNNIGDLHPAVRHWWQPWANEEGRVPFNYSRQFRHFHGERGVAVDCVALLIDGIRRHPYSRRNALTTWNTADMSNPDCPISNCHNSYTQAVVGADGRLSLFTVQRSVDVICGLPHNWFQEWAFLLWLGRQTGHPVGELIWTGVDVHLYEEHAELARRLVDLPPPEATPQLVCTSGNSDFLAADFALDGPYRPLSTETARMVV